ncbi:MAG: OprO/OprP family phosphate-selective porin [Gammaproteobacteria bacterium]
MMRNHRVTLLSQLVATAALAFSITSAEAAEKELLDILLGNGAISQQQYDDLLLKETLEQEDVAKISFAEGSGLKVSSGDGRYEVEIGGRLHLDYTDHSFDSRIGTRPVSGTQVRRARIEINGTFDQDWFYASEFDFAKNKVALKDIVLGYESGSGAKYIVGHQKQPYSLALEMSSNDIPFVERGVDNALVAALTDRAIGFRYENSGSNWFFAGGVFGDTLKEGTTTGDEGWGPSGRLIYSPIIEDDKVLHLGIRAAYREVDLATPTLSIKDKTTDFSELNIVNTGALADAESATLFGPEIAAAVGPLFFTAEHTTTEISRKAGSTLNFSSWNAAASWNITGESRASVYRIDGGEFKGIRPLRDFNPSEGAWGAWELSARYAEIDLNDGNLVGGEEHALSVGLNWIPTRNVRILADWTRILDTDESNTVRMYAPDTNVFTLRTQWSY